MKHENEIRQICEIIGISIEKVLEKKRLTAQVDARHLIFKWYRDNARMTYMEIAKIFKKDHATVIHGCHKADALIKYDAHFKAIWSAVSKVLIPTDEAYPKFTSLQFKSKATSQPASI